MERGRVSLTITFPIGREYADELDNSESIYSITENNIYFIMKREVRS